MIRTNAEYKRAKKSALSFSRIAELERSNLLAAGYSPDEVEYGVQPLLGLQGYALAEIEEYENWRRGELPVVTSLSGMGVLLIAARVAAGVKQKELATRLGVTHSIVSRDEANEYYGITMERAEKILHALGIDYRLISHLHGQPEKQGVLSIEVAAGRTEEQETSRITGVFNI